MRLAEMQKVIDVSYHNGSIDWERVKSAGYHAIIRCGYGSNFENQDDEQFKRNADECVRLNIPFGCYLYSYAKGATQAISEAEHAIRLCAPYRDVMAYPLFFDTEEPGTETVSQAYATIFCSRVKAAGFVPGIYASQAWWLENLPDVDGYVKWVARWSESEPIVHGWQLWQYSERGNVPGIKGNVDLNYSRYEIGNHGDVSTVDDLAREVIAGKYGNGEERKRKLGARASVVQLIVNRKLTGKWTGIDVVAREVIAGKWGNGTARRENLGSAYDVVQKRVNELMKHK
jgi:GH25 family lysozyme M1 (1,4-beta-N-acetylmuramidase)